ncbi:MAG TPA: hypothetical protein VM532_02135 [Burkholderiales bacterium]|nr:hypothetical protein [Burkholderiales bacterium]
MQPQFRVKLLERVQPHSIDSVLIKEIIAHGADEAMDVAVRLLAEEYSTTNWVAIEPWEGETIQDDGKHNTQARRVSSLMQRNSAKGTHSGAFDADNMTTIHTRNIQ